MLQVRPILLLSHEAEVNLKTTQLSSGNFTSVSFLLPKVYTCSRSYTCSSQCTFTICSSVSTTHSSPIHHPFLTHSPPIPHPSPTHPFLISHPTIHFPPFISPLPSHRLFPTSALFSQLLSRGVRSGLMLPAGARAADHV